VTFALTLAAAAATILAAAYQLNHTPLFAVDATVPYPNPNSRRSTMPSTTTIVPKPDTGELVLGDIATTPENPTLGNGSDPAVDVLVNYTLAHERDGERCIRVGTLTLTADQAIQLCAVLEPAARGVADIRQLIGDTT
jgi:hypothetical protein